MINRYLYNFKNFKCTADKCPDTCCKGWQIVIDQEALKKYKNDKASTAKNNALLSSPFTLEDKIDWNEQCFKLKPNGDCAFLNESGLCDLITNRGENYLCNTCDLYPRHIEEFPNVREYSLSASCPEVATQLLQETELITFTEEKTPEKDKATYPDFNKELYSNLIEYRQKAFEIIADKSQNFGEKCTNVLNMMISAQEKYDDIEEIDELNINVANSKEDAVSSDQQKAIPSNSILYYIINSELYSLILELDPFDKKFRKLLEKKEELFTEFTPELVQLIEDFDNAHPNWQRQCENLLYYYLFSYMCGAVYDEYIYAMTAQAIYNTHIIKLLWIAKYADKKQPLTTTEQAEYFYKYSRELENSTENMILLEELLDQEFF